MWARPANTRNRSDRAMADQAAGSLIRFTRLVTLPVLSTFTSQPSFTTSSSSTCSNAERLADLVAEAETRRRVLLVSGALAVLRGVRAVVDFEAMTESYG